MPLVSVVMPVHNGGRYVEAACRSILAQTFRDLELVVCDDGSTDDSLARVEAVADGRVRIVAGPHRGVSAARNAGIRSGDSELVAFMDADDVSRPDRLARQVDVLQEAPRYAAVGSSYEAIDETGGRICLVPHLADHRAVALAAYSFNPVCGSSMLIRRERLAAAGGFPDFDVAEDYELVCRLLRLGSAVGSLPEPLYCYRWHANTSRRRRDELTAAYAAVRDRHWELAPPAPTAREIFHGAVEYPTRLHVSALAQLTLGLARRRRFARAAVVAAATAAAGPLGVVRRSGAPAGTAL